MKNANLRYRGTASRLSLLMLSGLGLAVCSAVLHAEPIDGADTAFVNGRVYTVNAANDVVEAIAFKDGIVVAVGSDASILSQVSSATRVIDLQGKTVMPGLIDAHMHPAGGGDQLTACSLHYESLTIDEILARISACLAQDEGADSADWLRVPAWFRQATKPDGADLSTAVLDRVQTDRPVAVLASDFHTLAANRAAMAAAGITRDTPNPSGGEIVRDEQGNPTGIFLDAAMWLVLGAEPELSPQEQATTTLANVGAALREINSQGVTTIFSAGSGEVDLAAFRTLQEAGDLTVRGVFAIVFSPEEAADPAAAVASIRRHAAEFGVPGTATTPGITIDRAKIFVDGVIQGPAQTGAMIEPYLHNTGTPEHPHWVPSGQSGSLYYDQAMITAMLDALVADGLTAHLHTDGDAAVHIALNAVEEVRGRYNSPAFRPGFAHNEIVSPADYARFAQLDVVPVLSFQWGKPAPDTIETVQPFIGPERFRYLETAGKFAQAGARVAFGSDWPVDALAEWSAMQIAVTRENSHATATAYQGRLGDDPGLDVATAIRAFTINAAYSLNLEDRIGSLEPGKYADLIVIDRDLTAIPPDQIGQTRVLLTIVGGKEVYRAPGYE
ncbi:MAG: amidohydrolase [Alteraurantiacibacter sp.]